jgi:site-specific recombinase XerD
MAEIKFYLEKRKDKLTGEVVVKNVPIFLFYSFNGQRLQFYTGHRIDAQKWDAENQKVKRNYAETSTINDVLSSLRAKVKDLHVKGKALGIPLSIQYFKEGLNDTPEKIKVYAFSEVFDEFIEVSKLTKTKSTIINIQHAFKVFKEFSKNSGIKLEFQNINQEFYNKFLEYCFTVRNVKNNYTGKLIKDLKAFMSYATEKDYNTNLAFKKKSFKKLVEEPEIIYLTYEELMSLYAYEFEDRIHQETKDIFCFSCFTGLRYSDVKLLVPELVYDDYIIYRTQKTVENNNIPLNQYSKALLKKYVGDAARCFPVKSETETNNALKELAKIAGLNRIIQQNHYQGAKRITTTTPLHNLIGFHVSKKTFMTNFLARGGSLTTAMAITGNTDMKTARRYFKVVDTLKMDEMKKVFG